MHERRAIARSAAERMLDDHRRKRGQGLRLVQLWAFDRASPEVRDRLAREALLVRGHVSTREANEFLAALWDERLAPTERSAD